VRRAVQFGQKDLYFLFHPDEDKKINFKVTKGATASVKDTDICIPFKP
jgi:hypothetical protein